MEQWRVGEVAKRTGISVRTLHHYESIGLLIPKARTEAGHRLYSAEDLVRLQQIRSLQQLGFGLGKIREALLRLNFSPLQVVRLHRERLAQQIQHQQRLVMRLQSVEQALAHAETPSVEELFYTLEAMNMFEKYYTPEQLQALQARATEIGEDRIAEVTAIWPTLIAQVRQAMQDGLDPTSEPVQALAQQWMSLVREMSGGNPVVEQTITQVYREEPGVAQRYDLDPAIFAYIGQAMKGQG
jgi:DNA-binding transcriptional MerR regulator